MEKKNNLQAVYDYLVSNKVTPFNANLLMHTNIPALGSENTSMYDAAEEGNWEVLWAVVQLYLDGDLW